MIITPIVVPMEVSVDGFTVSMTVANSRQLIPFGIGAEYHMDAAELYDGEYTVTPRMYEQTLDTDRKLMADDVTVYEIPVTRTSNLQGGLTVLIG